MKLLGGATGSGNVLLLGVVSLLTDVSSEMILPLLPAFVTGVLGGGAMALGWMEGLAEATASLLKLLSGRWSDRLGRRRPFVLAGYALSSLARPAMAIAGAAWHVVAIRTLDRVGKGLRTSPRDALIAASVEPAFRARAFGLHRAMDHAGAVIGPLVAALYLVSFPGDLRTLFGLAAIPGTLAVIVLLFVRDPSPESEPGSLSGAARAVAPAASQPGSLPAESEPGSLPSLPDSRLRRLLLPIGLFTLGNSSDIFLLLAVGGERAPLEELPLLWMCLHLVKTLASIPGGWLADRYGRREIIAGGWVFYALIYAGFAFATDGTAKRVLFVLYGIYHGLTEGPEKALISEVVPKGAWGAGFGWYHLTLGALALAASVIFGTLWELAGMRIAFLTSAALALAAAADLARTRA